MNQKRNREAVYVLIDADAFFASVEEVLHRELKGKAIVVGQNGGIVSALSYSAKKLGIPRVMPIVTVRRNYPEVQIVSSDYYAYRIFSKRMVNIIKNYIPNIIKNSVDECSAEISPITNSYEEAQELLKELQEELFIKLGCSFSFGIGSSPLLAKLASGMNKPSGITILNNKNVKEKIYHLPVYYISGIGKKTVEKMNRYSIKTIGDLMSKDSQWLAFQFSKPMIKIQEQISGIVSEKIKEKSAQKSMSRARTFLTTDDLEYIHSQALFNVEYLSHRLRKDDLYTQRIGVSIRKSDLTRENSYITLTKPTSDTIVIFNEIKKLLLTIYDNQSEYRAVSVTVTNFSKEIYQKDLFGEIETSQKNNKIMSLMDNMEKKFGTTSIQLASSFKAKEQLIKLSSRRTEEDVYPHDLLPGEAIKKRLVYPFLGEI